MVKYKYSSFSRLVFLFFVLCFVFSVLQIKKVSIYSILSSLIWLSLIGKNGCKDDFLIIQANEKQNTNHFRIKDASCWGTKSTNNFYFLFLYSYYCLFVCLFVSSRVTILSWKVNNKRSCKMSRRRFCQNLGRDFDVFSMGRD